MAPIVMIKKKQIRLGDPPEFRMCQDFRALNQRTILDKYPLHHLDSMIQKCGSAKFLTSLDLSRGYYQLELTEESKPLMAFAIHRGLFQYTRMPFGLVNASSSFQRMVDTLLRPHSKYAVAYLDDICIFSATWEEHVQHLRAVLHAIKQAGLTVRPSKCQLGCAFIEYLGHAIGSGEIKPVQAKVKSVLDWPVPNTKFKVSWVW